MKASEEQYDFFDLLFENSSQKCKENNFFFTIQEAPQTKYNAKESLNGLVKFVYKPRLKKGIRTEKHPLFQDITVTLPQFMASDEFVEARELAAAWGIAAFRKKTQKNKAFLKETIKRFWDLVEQVRADIGEAPLKGTSHLPAIRPQGSYYNLVDVFNAVNEQFFSGSLTCRITWSNRIGGQSYHTQRTDPLTGEEFHLISISRAYDAHNCPKYAIIGVVYHECLHAFIPVENKNGRRIVHGKAFRQHEKMYMYYNEWIKWHKEILPLNIRRMKRGIKL